MSDKSFRHKCYNVGELVFNFFDTFHKNIFDKVRNFSFGRNIQLDGILDKRFLYKLIFVRWSLRALGLIEKSDLALGWNIVHNLLIKS